MPIAMKMILFFLLVVSCFAQQDSTQTATTALRHYPNPAKAAFMSGIIPGAGQFYDKSYIKGALFLGLEAYLGYSAYRKNSDARALLSGKSALTPGSDEYLAAQSAYGDDVKRRNIYLWTLAGVHFLGIVDAYIDAHLAPFDDEMGERISFVVPRSGLGLALRIIL